MSPKSHEPYLPFRGVDNDPAFYLPLDLNSRAHPVRLLFLHPGTPSSAIECSLSHKTLDISVPAIPAYEALSYCWGSIEDTVEIIRHGERRASPNQDSNELGVEVAPKSGFFRVTRNLESALRALRYEDEGHYRCLWIDAICINQMDPLEKNHQVGQMNMIYAYAETVLVWLGASDENSALVLKGAEIMEQETHKLTEGERSATARRHQRAWSMAGTWKQVAENFYCALNENEEQDLAMPFYRSLN